MGKLAIRDNTPKEDIDKFKEVFLCVIQEIGALPHVGKTVLAKIMYFIDFDFYEQTETQLMGMKYNKMPFGPYPVKFDAIIKQMVDAGDIEQVERPYFNYEMQKYLPNRPPMLSCLSGPELDHISQTIMKHKMKDTNQIVDYSHRDVPWLGAKDGEVLEYESVFYRTPETSVRKYSELNEVHP
jgi:hypothetical protein